MPKTKLKSSKIIIIFILIAIFTCSNTFATGQDEILEASGEGWVKGIDGVLTGLVGLILSIPKLVNILLGIIIRGIFAGMLSSAEGRLVDFSTYNILFNQIKLLDINFFDSGNTIVAMEVIKENIANWYNAFRMIASGGLLAVLVYIGIRMAISTVGEDKSKYKKFFQYWLESFVLLQLLHYIMVFVIYINNALVGFLSKLDTTQNGASFFEMLDLGSVLMPTVTSYALSICYIMLIAVTAVFFIIYLKRMMTIGFLIAIAPLITITYSIDKIRGWQKSSFEYMAKNVYF